MAYPDLTTAQLAMRSSLTAGTAGGAAGLNKQWLSEWEGEVIHAYDQYRVFDMLVVEKPLTGGFSWEFPITGTVSTVGVWEAGQELLGGDAASTTIKINLDKRPCASHFELDNVDLLLAQWDYKAELARQTGEALANLRDKQLAAYIARAAVEDLSWYETSYAVVSWGSDSGGTGGAGDPRGVNAGPVLANPALYHFGVSTSTVAQRQAACLAYLSEIEKYLVYLQDNHISIDGIVSVVTPQAFMDLRTLGIAKSTSDFANRPVFGGVSENGNLGQPLTKGLAQINDSLDYLGVRIIKSNHIPTSNYTGTTLGEARYNLNFADAGVCALIWHPLAVGSLSLIGVKADTVNDVRRGTQFFVSSMLKGTGVLRPELAAVFVKPTTTNTATDADGSITAPTSAAHANAGYLFWDDGGSPAASDVALATYGGTAISNAQMRAVMRKNYGSNFSREFVPTS